MTLLAAKCTGPTYTAKRCDTVPWKGAVQQLLRPAAAPGAHLNLARDWQLHLMCNTHAVCASTPSMLPARCLSSHIVPSQFQRPVKL
jgi:hypothetical protein